MRNCRQESDFYLILDPRIKLIWFDKCGTCITKIRFILWDFPRAWISETFPVNSLRPRQKGRLFADDTFKRIFLNENIIISTKNSLNFVPKGLINNIPALVLIMAWRRPGDKPLSEPMLVRSLTHICVTRPQWVKIHVSKQDHITRFFFYFSAKISWWSIAVMKHRFR